MWRNILEMININPYTSDLSTTTTRNSTFLSFHRLRHGDEWRQFSTEHCRNYLRHRIAIGLGVWLRAQVGGIPSQVSLRSAYTASQARDGPQGHEG